MTRPTRLRILLAVGVVAATALAIKYFAGSSSDVNEAALRDTAGIEVRVTGSRPSARGVVVSYTIHNTRELAAASIVLNVSLMTMDAQPVAGNPLVNVLSLGPGESRQLSASVPLVGVKLPAHWQAEAQVSLVRWQSER